jgi:hypothetical protein
MESVYHIVTIRVNETFWAHEWRLRSRYLGTGMTHTLHRSVVPVRVTVLLELCNPPCRGRGEPAKPGLLYPLVWIPCWTISEKLGS